MICLELIYWPLSCFPVVFDRKPRLYNYDTGSVEPPEKHLALLGYSQLEGLEMVSEKAGSPWQSISSRRISLLQELYDMCGNGMALTAVAKVLAPLLVRL